MSPRSGVLSVYLGATRDVQRPRSSSITPRSRFATSRRVDASTVRRSHRSASKKWRLGEGSVGGLRAGSTSTSDRVSRLAPLHLAFAASDRATVECLPRGGVSGRGHGNGAPGLRPHYHGELLRRVRDRPRRPQRRGGLSRARVALQEGAPSLWKRRVLCFRARREAPWPQSFNCRSFRSWPIAWPSWAG